MQKYHDEPKQYKGYLKSALEAAHEQGVIHRDLKPANVKVRPDGTVKVLDFGLAKAMQPEASDVSASMSPTISLTAAATQMGMVIGTAAYMAPEQASGKVVDKRADVWVFGEVLYEILTGTRPFIGDDVSKTLARVIDRDPDWSALPKELPPVLTNFLRGCLEKNPKQRVGDIRDVRLAMEGAFETTVGATAEAIGAPQLHVWQRPVPAVVAALTLVTVSGFAVWSLSRPAPPPPDPIVQFTIPLGADERFTRLGRHLVALSPDGTRLVYQANQQLYLRQLDQLQATAIPGTRDGDGRSPFISPDGEWIGFFAGGQLKKVAMSGGAPVSLCDVTNPFGVSWGTDDVILYGQGADGIWQVPGTGGTPVQVIAVEEDESAHGPQMLPGGEWVLFTFRSGTTSWDEAQIVVQSLVNDERVVLIEGGQDARYLPTGHLVYALSGVLLAVPFDLAGRRVTGGPVPLVENVGYTTGATGAAHFSVADNGSLAYVPGGLGTETRTLVWVDRQGREEPVAAPPRDYVQPRISPDGTRVVLDVRDQEDDLWIWDLVRETPTRFTFDPGQDWYPVWTPDSQRIVFGSSRAGDRNLFWKAADGSGTVEQLTEGPNNRVPNAFSPDGTRLLFREIHPNTDDDLVVLLMEGDRSMEPLLATEFGERNAAVSPDGRWVTYESNASGQYEIYVRPFPDVDQGGLSQISMNGGVQPLWGPDGRELFYRSDVGLMVVPVETDPSFTAGNPEVIVEGPYRIGAGRTYDIAPDGQRFLFITRGLALSEGQSRPQLIFVENWLQELTERVPID